MNILTAKNVIGRQIKNIRKLNNVRYVYGGREYRLNYDNGWFAPMIAVYCREIGKRKFHYIFSVNVTHVTSTEKAYNLCIEKIHEMVIA